LGGDGGSPSSGHLGLAWEAPVTEPSCAPPVLEFESWSEVVGETAAPGGRLMGPVRASGPSRRSGGFAEGDFGGPQALAAAVWRGSEAGRPACCGLEWGGGIRNSTLNHLSAERVHRHRMDPTLT